jgi:aspartate/methionine/tyrosine aminotransferase
LNKEEHEFARPARLPGAGAEEGRAVDPAEPHGAFYVYADVGRDARAFARELLEKEAVAATPESDFGGNGTDRYVRFAYTRSMEDLEELLDGLPVLRA